MLESSPTVEMPARPMGELREASESGAGANGAAAVPGLTALRETAERLAETQKQRFGFGNIITRCSNMEAVFEKVRAALTNASAVLISGESGTGKEVVARTVHNHGLQARGPFIPLNCSALPRDLIESELFGHVKGAFTGAVQEYQGLLRAAQGGTIFLDEIGGMPLETQTKLLRTLQDKRVRPVGSTIEIPVQVRIISALNQPPREAIAAGKLREDLFYRLSVIGIDLPRLAERREDIPLLVQAFVDELNQGGLRKVDTIAPDAWDALLRYDWPGNVRELSNAVESAFALGDGNTLRRKDFPFDVQNGHLDAEGGAAGGSLLLDPVLARVEREAINRALRAAGWQRNKAASLMGISRSRLYRRMEALGINPRELR